MNYLELSNSYREKVKCEVPGAGGRVNGELEFNEYRVQFGEMF